jgi:FkbM family methyltransferase
MHWIRRLAEAIQCQALGRHALGKAGDMRWLSPVAAQRTLAAASRWGNALPPRFRPRVILDVGANTGGIASELIALYRPDFVGLVEANPDLAAKLAHRRFGCRTRVFACAMGERIGRTPFTIVRKGEGDNLASSSILTLSAEAKCLWQLREEKTIDVPMRTLDDVWQECASGDILDLLKLDVQGYEPQVLMGGNAMLPHTRVVACEMSFFREYDEQWLFRELYAFLNDRGFELSSIYEVARRDRWAPLQCNGVFVNTRLPVPA